MIDLTALQKEAMAAEGTSFLLGMAGTGRTTAVHHRLLRLLAEGEPAYTILTIVAEPDRAQGFLTAVQQSELGPYGDLTVTTYSKMAMEMVDLFWPLVARPAGFVRPYQPPTFLTYDLAQLLMWHIITPMLNAGAFADLRLRPQQIVSQLLDTLNRAALNSLTLDEAILRQKTTWTGEPERLIHLEEAAEAARQFRQTCLEQSLLDLSLAVEVFDTQLVHHPEFHRYFSERFRHLIVDNMEEQTPAGQNFVAALMDEIVSTAVVYDIGGGYKRFLAADPDGGMRFATLCRRVFRFEESFVTNTPLIHLANLVQNHLEHSNLPTAVAGEAIWGVVGGRYRREMVAELAEFLADLSRDRQIAPGDIAIIAPYLDGALRYMLTQACQKAGLPYYFLRRRSSPRDEPRIRAWLTWLALAHSEWDWHPTDYDVAEALTLSIAGLDPARAELITEWLYRPETPELLPLDNMPERIRERVGADMAGLAEELRLWLAECDANAPIEQFLYDLFQFLSQYRFHPEPDTAGAAVCDWLMQQAVRLRQSGAAIGLETPAAVGRTFIDGINQGLVTANPPDLGEPPDPDGIMISTIYGYLLAGEPVQVQVWLETAATGWWDIPNQPLSNAFVLAQSYDGERPWTIADDGLIRNQLLSHIIRGLTARCSGGLILASSDLDRRGVRQDGPLWRALGTAVAGD